ncbi:MAG: PEP-CTERM sorting domain-containing protein, partial [Armatimonadetes bacterium]|nr:PEP-CTERM sorting domain-containing protein [Armatimonadota bacterium]
MQRNQGWVKSLTVAACILAMTGVSHAQTATLTSSAWNSITGTTTFAGPPAFTTALVGTPAGTFGNATLALGEATGIAFNPGFQISVANVAGTATGTNTGNFTFVINGATVPVSIPITYTVTNSLVGFSSSTPVIFTAGGQDFQISASSSSGVTATGTPQTVTFGLSIQFMGLSSAPEPGTLALFGLGVAPIAVAIRRR